MSADASPARKRQNSGEQLVHQSTVLPNALSNTPLDAFLNAFPIPETPKKFYTYEEVKQIIQETREKLMDEMFATSKRHYDDACKEEEARIHAIYDREVALLEKTLAKNAALQKENRAFLAEIADLQKENAAFRKKNGAFRKENASLQKENTTLQTENSAFWKEITDLKTKNNDLNDEIKNLKTRFAVSEKYVASLQAEFYHASQSKQPVEDEECDLDFWKMISDAPSTPPTATCTESFSTHPPPPPPIVHPPSALFAGFDDEEEDELEW